MSETEKAPRVLTLESRIALAKDQVSCELAGEMAVVNLHNGVYYGLDPTGTRIWKLLTEPVTLDELCRSLVHIYDVERSRLESDVRVFISELADQGLIDIT